jgi:peptidoglycan/LPS O-acetylase OafA/YrhL
MFWQSLLIPLVIVGTVLNPDSIVGQVLELPPIRWVGRISYSLYLWQELFLVPFREQGQLGFLQYLPFSVAAAFTCAALSYYAVERPMMRLGHRLAPPTTEGRI